MGKGNKIIEAKYKGELVQLENQGNGEYKVTRILSTNPKAFLNKDLQPGILVNQNNIDKIINKIY